MFSLLWSEHCAYKHSRKLLRRLPTEGERVLMGPGENAGAVSVGDGWAVAFKVESHNHPSAVEPFQGAATGVGGILRDVFALGARPIAVLDSLRFGELDSRALALPVRPRRRRDRPLRQLDRRADRRRRGLLRGALRAELPRQRDVRRASPAADEMVRAAAAGVGNTVVLMGASTGRDGIGGASVLASAELEGGDDSKRPSVQIGDPFEESKLLECCLELLGDGLLVSLQDLGAAGLTSSAGEMASSGGVGIDIDVARVPLREDDMEPFEIMVSESQERMLAVVEPDEVDEVLALCERWQTGAAVIGEVTGRRDLPGAARRRGGRRDAGRGAGRRVPAVRPRPGRARRAGSTGTRATLAARRTAGATILLRAARLADHRQQALGVRAVRLDRRLAHRPPARGRRRRGAAAPRGRGDDRGLDRRQRAPRRLRSLRGHGRGGARVRPEPRLRGRRAARAHQLPELRQPGEADGRLAARPLDPGARRRLRGARRPGRRRQRLALQRDRGGPDLPDAGRRHGRRAPRSRARRRPGARATATRSRSAARSRPRSPARSWRSCAASSVPGCPSLPIAEVARGDRGGPRRGRARARSAAPTTSPTAGSPARSPRWRSPAGSGSRSTSTGWSRRAAARARRRSSARGRAASSSPATAARARGGSPTAAIDVFVARQRRRRADLDRGRRGRARRSRSPTPSAPGARWRERIERAGGARVTNRAALADTTGHATLADQLRAPSAP